MTTAIAVELDLKTRVAYVTYQDESVPFASNKRINQDVVADLSAAGEVIGIELLALDDDTLAVARGFAHAHGLSFPANLGGAATQA